MELNVKTPLVKGEFEHLNYTYKYVLLDPAQLLYWTVNNEELTDKIENMVTIFIANETNNMVRPMFNFRMVNFILDGVQCNNHMYFLFVTKENKNDSENKNEEIISVCRCNLDYDTSFISSFVINEQYRNIGLGTKIMKLFIDLNKKLFFPTMIRLEVFDHNCVAKTLYEKLGFTYNGSQRTIYVDENMDEEQKSEQHENKKHEFKLILMELKIEQTN